jgi:hypothetical protein
MADAFYEPDGDQLIATALTRGPWDDRYQHGGPPSALLAGALERHPGDFSLVRFGVELLRPVPIGPLRIVVQIERAGRQVERLSASLWSEDVELVRGSALRIRKAPMVAPPPPPDPAWPDPETLQPFAFPFFRSEVAYHRGVEVKVAYGAWGKTPVGFWARPVVPLVAGRASSPLERLVILADAQSGMGPPLDPLVYSYLNPDLALYLERPPEDGWLGFDIRSVVGPDGAGLSQSALRDRRGGFGRSLQTLVIARRLE